jgi:arsenate reductase
MAEAFLNRIGEGRFSAESAGIEPGRLNPDVVAVMAEIGYDLSANKTKSVHDLAAKGGSYDYVVTVCDPEAAERCPVFPGNVTRLHWGFKDPSSFKGTDDERLDFTRKVRDEIKLAIEDFAKKG